MSDSLIPPGYFENQKARSKGGPGCIGGSLIFLVLLLVAGFAVAFFFGIDLKNLAQKAILGEFFTTHATTKNRDVILEINPTHGDILEVASPMKTTEFFQKSDTRFAAWGWIFLGTATSEIKVPATYRFNIKLSEMKDARLEDGVLIVTAPDIKPSLPVAIDTSGLEKKAAGTWLRFDTAQHLEDLEKTITPVLNARATDHAKTVREIARSDIEKFVQKWVVDARPEYQAEVKAIKIRFPDEKNSAATDKPTPSGLP